MPEQECCPLIKIIYDQIGLNPSYVLYTHPNFQRPHFQFDTVWLIDHVNFTTLYFNKASLKFFLKFCN